MLYNENFFNLNALSKFLNNEIFISLIQRNYLWEKENIIGLFKSIYENYLKKSSITIGMATFKGNEIIDAQQRIISIFIILKALGYDMNLRIIFERDETVKFKREDFLKKLSINYLKSIENIYLYPDLNRFKDNFLCITNLVKNIEDKKSVVNYIQNEVYLMVYFTKIDVFDEFININENKTYFTLSDIIKSFLIFENHNEVFEIFDEVSKLFYLKENTQFFNLIKRGYNYQNRVDILFIDEYLKNSKSFQNIDISYFNDFNSNEQIIKIKFYLKILNKLKKECDNNYYENINKFCYFLRMINKNFFEVLIEYYKFNIENLSNFFDKIIYDYKNLLNNEKILKIKYASYYNNYLNDDFLLAMEDYYVDYFERIKDEKIH